MLLANLAIFLLGYVESKTIVYLLRVPFGLLAPTILLTATIGAYALRNLLLDVWVMYLAGLVGFFMRRTGYSMPGVVLGVILGGIGESAFVKTMQMLDYNVFGLFTRPIAALLIALALASIAYSVYRGMQTDRDSGVFEA